MRPVQIAGAGLARPAALALVLVAAAISASGRHVAAQCGPNPIACENQ